MYRKPSIASDQYNVDDIQRESLNPPTRPAPMAQPQPHQHRSLQPTGGPPPAAVPLNRPRVDDTLDVIRQEFDYMSQELTTVRNQRDEYEAKSLFNSFSSLSFFVFNLFAQSLLRSMNSTL